MAVFIQFLILHSLVFHILIERLLFPPQSIISKTRQGPDWLEIHRELKRKGVTLALLWQEYNERDPEGYQYSWFCKLYNKWAGTIDLVMRQNACIEDIDFRHPRGLDKSLITRLADCEVI